jgi:hypothetical protein
MKLRLVDPEEMVGLHGSWPSKSQRSIIRAFNPSCKQDIDFFSPVRRGSRTGEERKPTVRVVDISLLL